MKHALHTKLEVLVATTVAFAAGLVVAGLVGVTPETRATGLQGRPQLQVGAPDSLIERLEADDARRGFSGVAEHISGTVVTIFVDKKVGEGRLPEGHPSPGPFDDFFDPPQEDPRDGEGGGGRSTPRTIPGSGSGFIVSHDGFVVTNNHVVENAESITVALSDQREFDDVRIVGRDPTTDVALLKLDAEGLPRAPLGRSEELRVGDWVLAVGSPGFGGGDILPSTVTAGIVSGKGRNIGILGRRFVRRNQPNLAIEDFIQTDAVINRGNSGGPLVNTRGEVVGVSTAIMSENGYYQGYGFAVPIDLVREVIDDLMQHGEVRRPVLGVLVEEVSPADARYYGLREVGGAKVADFSRDGAPALEAGIEAGDVIVAVGGDRVRSVSDLQRKIRAREPGETVEITVVRREDRERATVEVTLAAARTPASSGAGPDAERGSDVEETADPLGVDVIDLSEEVREKLEARLDRDVPDDVTGVVVVDAERDGPLLRSAGATLGQNPIIEDVDGRDLQGIEDYRAAVSELGPGDVASLRVYLPDLGQRRFLSVEIPER